MVGDRKGFIKQEQKALTIKIRWIQIKQNQN